MRADRNCNKTLAFCLLTACLVGLALASGAEVIKKEGVQPNKNQLEEAPTCGDGKCEGAETTNVNLCPADCDDDNLTRYDSGNAPPTPVAPCPDGQCTPEEAKEGTCPADCSGQGDKLEFPCGDGICQDPEKSSGACPKDCDSLKDYAK